VDQSGVCNERYRISGGHAHSIIPFVSTSLASSASPTQRTWTSARPFLSFAVNKDREREKHTKRRKVKEGEPRTEPINSFTIEGRRKAQTPDWEDRGKIQDPNGAKDYPHYDPEIDSNFSRGSPEIR
jgi:hypothetical protein